MQNNHANMKQDWLAQVKAKHVAFRAEFVKVMIAGAVTLAAGLSMKSYVEAGNIIAVIGVFGLGWATRGLRQAVKIDTQFKG